MKSSQDMFKNREERKEETRKPQLECDPQLVRHLQKTRAPNVILDDAELRMEWGLRARSLHNGDKISFMQALVSLQTKCIELKMMEEEFAIISTKKKKAILDLDSKTCDIESKTKQNNNLELCAIAKKEGAIAEKDIILIRKDIANAEKASVLTRIKIELDFVKRKCDAELEKLTKKPRPTSNKLTLPILKRLIKHRHPNVLITHKMHFV